MLMYSGCNKYKLSNFDLVYFFRRKMFYADIILVQDRRETLAQKPYVSSISTQDILFLYRFTSVHLKLSPLRERLPWISALSLFIKYCKPFIHQKFIISFYKVFSMLNFWRPSYLNENKRLHSIPHCLLFKYQVHWP